MPTNDAKKDQDESDNWLICPFCFSHDLEGNRWQFGEETIDAIECRSCFASAPVYVWQNRKQVIQECPNCLVHFLLGDDTLVDDDEVIVC